MSDNERREWKCSGLIGSMHGWSQHCRCHRPLPERQATQELKPAQDSSGCRPLSPRPISSTADLPPTVAMLPRYLNYGGGRKERRTAVACPAPKFTHTQRLSAACRTRSHAPVVPLKPAHARCTAPPFSSLPLPSPPGRDPSPLGPSLLRSHSAAPPGTYPAAPPPVQGRSGKQCMRRLQMPDVRVLQASHSRPCVPRGTSPACLRQRRQWAIQVGAAVPKRVHVVQWLPRGA